jgi:hypothetical protein
MTLKTKLIELLETFKSGSDQLASTLYIHKWTFNLLRKTVFRVDIKVTENN